MLIFISAFNVHLKHDALCIPVFYVCHVYYDALLVLYTLTTPVNVHVALPVFTRIAGKNVLHRADVVGIFIFVGVNTL